MATMRKIRKKKLSTYLLRFIDVVCILLVAWFIISFIDVNLHNLTPGGTQASWNLFKIFFGN